MGRAIERIEQDLKAIEESISKLTIEFETAYSIYLTHLGSAVRQQLVLASYEFCTQSSPEKFLSLSLKMRQKLQQDIRQLSQKVEAELSSLMKVKKDTAELGIGEEISSPQPAIITPIDLAEWQHYLEEAIADQLKIVSRDANVLLRVAGIIPKITPLEILEDMNASIEASEILPPMPPEISKLIDEVENERRESRGPMTQKKTVIGLRLIEIELADVTVNSGRNKIRHLLTELGKLGREYQKQQRQWAIAAAESAWRASWFE
jgi:hypothetical protein